MKRTGNRRKKTQHVKPGHLLAMQAGFFNPRRYVAALVVVFTYMGHSSFAQPFDLGSWNIMHLRHHLTSKWSLFGEAQVRSLKFYTHFHYYEYKGGVHYRARPGLTLSLGLGDYDTYGEGGNFVVPKNNDELRIWPQLALQQSIGRFLVEQRYRAELRFTSQGYRNRFRYRVGLSYPFGKEREGQRIFALNANNELFFTDREPYFERNRMSVFVTWKVQPQLVLLAGYLHQFDYRINDETGRDFLQIGVLAETFRRKPVRERSPKDHRIRL